MTGMADAPKPRWYRLTPDRCVVALLALEGILLLSAWFRWFPFNQHKGWAVLITIAGVGVALLLMFLWFLAALVFRLRFQFSLLSLLLLVVVVAVPFSWLATEMKQARRQREVVEGMRKAGVWVSYDDEFFWLDVATPGAKPSVPAWLRNLLGEDLFSNVPWVVVSLSKHGDAGLEHLNELTHLQRLELRGPTVRDATVEDLTGLTQLQWLDLSNTKVSDAGLRHLKGLPQLRYLSLLSTDISDSGLEYLKGLTQLQTLDLRGTNVGDAGLQHLEGLTQLQRLDLWATKVTDAGVKKLQQALPNCKIQH